MFNRYTEKARRVIFFSRYEASQFGSPFIETEHLLLGVLREDKDLTQRILKQKDVDSIRPQIERRTYREKPFSVDVDLPLSNESKRVLAYGAEEAERMAHRQIAPEHLFLGLLREKSCFAAELLRDCGLDIERLRKEFSKRPAVVQWNWPAHHTYHVPPKNYRSSVIRDTIEIHDSRWNAEYIHDLAKKCREFSWHWSKLPWVPRDIAIHRETGKISFDVTLVESSKDFDLVKGGWKKDYCAICRWELFESKDAAEHATGYSNGRDWLCTECYEKFIQRSDFFSSNYPDIT